MIRKLPLLAVFLVTACAVPIILPVPTQMPSPTSQTAPVESPRSAKERFVSSVEANGCALTSRNTDLIMVEAILSREDMARVMTDLRAEGRGVIGADGQSFQLVSGRCA